MQYYLIRAKHKHGFALISCEIDNLTLERYKVTFGTDSRVEYFYGDLPFDVVASLSQSSPKTVTLYPYVETCDFIDQLHASTLKSVRGFQTFFGRKVNSIKILFLSETTATGCRDAVVIGKYTLPKEESDVPHKTS